MPLLVFLRGVNVGGHKAFQPSVLARELEDLDVKSIGAAGTFIVQARAQEKAVRAAFLKRLPFDAQVMICTGQELADLVRDDPFRDQALSEGIKRFVSVLERRPRGVLRLPIHQPEGGEWQVAVVAVQGRFAVSLHRRTGRAFVYPNEVVEKRLGIPATTRNWNTILTLYRAIEPLCTKV